ALEALTSIEIRRARVARLHLEVERERTACPRLVSRGGQQQPSDAALAMRRLDVQLLQPHRRSPVLERPHRRERGDADDPPVHDRDQDGAALLVRHEPVERERYGGLRRVDAMLAELRHEQCEHRVPVRRPREPDGRGAHDSYSRPACTRYSATSTSPFAAPRRVLCASATYLSPLGSTGSGRSRPTLTAMPPSASRSSLGCGRNGSSCTTMGWRGAPGRSRPP